MASAGTHVADAIAITVEIIGAMPGQQGFAAQPWRWVIEHLQVDRPLPSSRA